MTLSKRLRRFLFYRLIVIRRRKSQSNKILKVLVVRPDRLGDVILSTPVLEVVKRSFPKSHLTFLVKDALKPILEGLPSVDQIATLDLEGRHAGFKGFFTLLSEVKEGRYRFAIVLQSHWKIAFVLLLARVRYRVGPLSKPYSFFTFNRGLRQHRSHVEMHEADYNLQLLQKLGMRVGSRSIPTRVHVKEEVLCSARSWLAEKGWKPDLQLITVHPGMGGSALNWPETHYHDLIRLLAEDGCQVLVTGGPQEVELIERIKSSVEPTLGKIFFYQNTSGSALDFFAALIKCSNLVIAPSTGPLHLAVALDRPVLCFYPPIRVQSAIRWGPYLLDEKRASVLVPEVYCGQDFRCLGSLCHYFPCMKSLSVNQAVEQARLQLRLSDPHPAKEN